MRVVDDDLLAEFREPGFCDWCGKRCSLREPHHLFARGMGGGARLDVRINLVSLGSSLLFQCPCHRLVHAGEIMRFELIALVAAREGLLQMDIEDALHRMRRAPKECSVCPCCQGVPKPRCIGCGGSGIVDQYGMAWSN